MTGFAAGQQAGRAGSSFLNVSAAGAGSTTVVPPASNVNGVVVRNCTMENAAGSFIVLCSGTVAPTTVTSNQVLAGQGSGAVASQMTPRDIVVPSGQGIYVYSQAASQNAWLGFDIL
jgi:hypothetical protein